MCDQKFCTQAKFDKHIASREPSEPSDAPKSSSESQMTTSTENQQASSISKDTVSNLIPSESRLEVVTDLISDHSEEDFQILIEQLVPVNIEQELPEALAIVVNDIMESQDMFAED